MPWKLLSSSLARTPRASRRPLLLEGVVLGSLVQTAAEHDLPDARERSIRKHSSEVEWRREPLGVVRSLEVLSVAGGVSAAAAVSTSADQDPEHRGDEEYEAEDQRWQGHIDRHALSSSTCLDLLARQMGVPQLTYPGAQCAGEGGTCLV